MEETFNPIAQLEASVALWLCYIVLAAAVVAVVVSAWKAIRLHSGSTGREHGVPVRKIGYSVAAATAACLCVAALLADGLAAMMLDSCLAMLVMAAAAMLWSGTKLKRNR